MPRTKNTSSQAAPDAVIDAVAADTMPAPTKSAVVLALLQRSEGAALAELVEATGWQPHTTRAVLTGLRQKGHVVIKSGERGASRYRIEDAA